MPKELADAVQGRFGLSNTVFSPNGQMQAIISSDRSIKLWDIQSRKFLHSFEGHKTSVISVSFSPDGKMLVSSSYNGSTKLWDIQSKKLIHSFEFQTGYTRTRFTAFSPDGTMLITVFDNGSAKLWDIQSKTLFHSFGGGVNSMSFNSNGQILAIVSDDQSIELWDIQSKQHLQFLEGHTGEISQAIFSPNGKTLISTSNDQSLKLWDVQSAILLSSFEGSQYAVKSLAFSPDSQVLAFASSDKTIKLWDIQRGKLISSFEEHVSTAQDSIIFSPNGKMLLSISMNTGIKLWGVKSQQLLHSFEKDKSYYSSASFSPDGKMLVITSYDDAIRLWDIQSKQLIHIIEGREKHIQSVNFSPDGKMLVSSSTDEAVKLWDIQTKQLTHTLEGHSFDANFFEGHKFSVNSVIFSPNGKVLASVSDDETLKLWDVQTKQLIHSFKNESFGYITSVSFSFDGKLLALGSVVVNGWISSGGVIGEGKVKLWDIKSKKLIHTFEDHKKNVNSVTFSPDGKTLASASADKTIKLWDIQSKKLIHSFEGHNKAVNSVVFSPNGQVLASASNDESVKLWDIQSKKMVYTFKQHTGAVNSVIFSPDGQKLASASTDQSLKLWDTQSRELIYSFEGHNQAINSVVFSPDGQMLASASDDQTVKLWDIQNKKLQYDLISGIEGNWLWQDRQTGQFWRGDDGSFLLQKNKGYIPLPPPNIASVDKLDVTKNSEHLILESGKQSKDLVLTIKNIGDKPVWWIRTLQPKSDYLTVYPAKHYRLSVNETTQLTIPISVNILNVSEPFSTNLEFDLITAAGTRTTVSIPVTVQMPKLEWQSADMQDDNRTLTFAVTNQGTQDIPEAYFQLAGFNLEPQTVKNIPPKGLTELAFVLPENHQLTKDDTVSLTARTHDTRLFEWKFENKSVTFPTPPWQLYLALAFLLMLITVAIIYIRRYRHPLVLQLSDEPHDLFTLPLEQLPDAYKLLSQTRRLQKVLSDAGISKAQLEEAIRFVTPNQKKPHNLQAEQRANWVAQRLGSSADLVGDGLFRIKLNEQFPLNVDQFLIYHPVEPLSAANTFNYLKSVPETRHIITFIAGQNSDFQRELRRKTLDTSNKWVAPEGHAISEFLLSDEPESVLARVIAEQIPLTQISPYQLGGGTSRESMFFGRMEMIAHIMNRDPANYLLVAGRQLGKSSLLKAIERRYDDHAQVRCFYRALANEKLAPQLARALGLSGRSTMEEIVEHLEQRIKQDKRHYLFLIDEADTFIRHEREQDYPTLNTLRQLSESGHCSFILAGFWHLYDYSVLDYQSPLKNFGEVMQLGALEVDACKKLISQPMLNMGIRYASDSLVDDLIEQTGQRANLISITCNEILKQLGKEQRVIEAGDIHRALQSDSISRALEGWKNLSGVADDDRIDRIIVYSMIMQEQFSLSELAAATEEKGFNLEIASIERSLARLELAFILQRDGKYYSWRVPLFTERLREQELEIRLKGELQ